MPKHATGSKPFQLAGGTWAARLSLAGRRETIRMPHCMDEPAATALGRELAAHALQLAAAHANREDSLSALILLGNAPDERRQHAARVCVAKLTRGERPRAASDATTVQAIGEQWTSGELHRLYPDHFQGKRGELTSAKLIAARLVRYVYPVIGGLPPAAVDLDGLDEIKKRLPAHLSPGYRRNIMSHVRRLFSLAVYPLKLIKASPVPRGWVPPAPDQIGMAYLYPDEWAQLMACTRVPLARRILWGFLSKEGPRPGETVRMSIGKSFDLQRGRASVTETKTTPFRAWALAEGTAPALATWVERYRVGPPDGAMFLDQAGQPWNLDTIAELVREDLLTAGITRAELHESTDAQRQMRAYDLRATFVTVALANDRTEKWVMARTGHTDSSTLEYYQRMAKTMAELDLGELRDMPRLDHAIPELRAHSPNAGPPAGSGAPQPGTTIVLQPASEVETPTSPGSNGTVANHCHALATASANPLISLTAKKFLEDFCAIPQAIDMAKQPRNPSPATPSNPVQPDARGESLANQIDQLVLLSGHELAAFLKPIVERAVARGIASALVDFATTRPVVTNDADEEN